MTSWIKDTTDGGEQRIISADPLNDNAAKRAGEFLLRTICIGCLYMQMGRYGFEESQEGSAGARQRRPYKICPGINRSEAKC